jgi:hypothetical protein
MDYIMVFEDLYQNNCENCGEIYTDIDYKWCKSCQMNLFKNDFANWSSENEEIDNFIQERQLSINNFYDKIFEWIPYNQFNEIKEISKSEFDTLYSAMWEDGPLYYNDGRKELMRISNEKVALKCLHNSQNKINELLSEVRNFSNLFI